MELEPSISNDKRSHKRKQHIHKYHKIEIAGNMLWACALPDCNHYMPKHMENIVPGKSSLCWDCGRTFTLDALNMTQDKPKCDKCSGANKITQYLEDAGVWDMFGNLNLQKEKAKIIEKEEPIKEETEHKRLIDEIEDYTPSDKE